MSPDVLDAIRWVQTMLDLRASELSRGVAASSLLSLVARLDARGAGRDEFEAMSEALRAAQRPVRPALRVVEVDHG